MFGSLLLAVHGAIRTAHAAAAAAFAEEPFPFASLAVVEFDPAGPGSFFHGGADLPGLAFWGTLTVAATVVFGVHRARAHGAGEAGHRGALVVYANAVSLAAVLAILLSVGRLAGAVAKFVEMQATSGIAESILTYGPESPPPLFEPGPVPLLRVVIWALAVVVWVAVLVVHRRRAVALERDAG